VLTSYSSNAAVFGLVNGGTARMPATFALKGTSNTVLFAERYAATTVAGGQHTWPSISANNNYLYAAQNTSPGWNNNVCDPVWGVAAANLNTTNTTYPCGNTDNTAHGFNSSLFQVAIGDGSVRIVTTELAQPMSTSVGARTGWTWACVVIGPISTAPPPSGW
jgi:hypothetical protein